MSIRSRRVRHALALTEHGSFREAARSLGMSQSALSRSIQALEAGFGTRLFDRLPTGVRPTACGEVFLRWARQMDADAESLERELRQVRGLEAGEVRAALGPYPADLLRIPATTRLLGESVGIHFSFRTCAWREVHRRVRTRDVDVGVAEISEDLEEPLLRLEPLGRHRIVWYLRPGHPLLGRTPLALEDLLSFPWVGPVATSRMTTSFPRQAVPAGKLDERTREFRPAILVDELDAARRIVRGSDALGAAMLTQLETDLERGSLAVLPFEAPWLRLQYGTILLRGPTPAPAVDAFLKGVRQAEHEVEMREAQLRKRWLRTP